MQIERINKKIKANPNRVILKYFNLHSKQRIISVLDRIKALPENEVENLLTQIYKDFGKRHQNFEFILLENYSRVKKYYKDNGNISRERELLIGAYFSKEYSIEAASLFNPSIIPHPDQSYLKPGMLRFIISLRSTGEGHISSIEFKSGVLDESNEILLDPETGFASLPSINKEKNFAKSFIKKRLKNVDEKILNMLNEAFTCKEAVKFLKNNLLKENRPFNKDEIQIIDLLESNYEIQFNKNTLLNERVIFPVSKVESHGMEDVRFVKFINDDGSFIYYGTYTAYNGFTFRTQLIETKDFYSFNIHTLHGDAVADKGMALFPRKINGKYAIISRQGGENLQIMYSDSLYTWEKFELLENPKEPWQIIQLGNCGSPIETKKGWLLITHAVGAIRKYCLGAILLDISNPSKVIGSLKEPLLEPDEKEREGYVPNVLYSCGSLVYNNILIIPYAMSDSATGFAKVKLDDLLSKF